MDSQTTSVTKPGFRSAFVFNKFNVSAALGSNNPCDHIYLLTSFLDTLFIVFVTFF